MPSQRLSLGLAVTVWWLTARPKSVSKAALHPRPLARRLGQVRLGEAAAAATAAAAAVARIQGAGLSKLMLVTLHASSAATHRAVSAQSGGATFTRVIAASRAAPSASPGTAPWVTSTGLHTRRTCCTLSLLCIYMPAIDRSLSARRCELACHAVGAPCAPTPPCTGDGVALIDRGKSTKLPELSTEKYDPIWNLPLLSSIPC